MKTLLLILALWGCKTSEVLQTDKIEVTYVRRELWSRWYGWEVLKEPKFIYRDQNQIYYLLPDSIGARGFIYRLKY